MKTLLAATVAALVLAHAGGARADLMAEEQESPAKGTRSCALQQIQSEYLKSKYQADLKQYGYAAPEDAPIVVNVHRDGSVGILVIAETFPGTRTYVKIGGHRYSGRDEVKVPVEALKSEQLVQFTYTSWPENYDVNGEDVLAGFASAYQKCLSWMQG